MKKGKINNKIYKNDQNIYNNIKNSNNVFNANNKVYNSFKGLAGRLESKVSGGYTHRGTSFRPHLFSVHKIEKKSTVEEKINNIIRNKELSRGLYNFIFFLLKALIYSIPIVLITAFMLYLYFIIKNNILISSIIIISLLVILVILHSKTSIFKKIYNYLDISIKYGYKKFKNILISINNMNNIDNSIRLKEINNLKSQVEDYKQQKINNLLNINKQEASNKVRPLYQNEKNKLIVRVGNKCEVCKQLYSLEVHHIQSRGESGGNDELNLIVLCPTCHSQAHANAITKSRLFYISKNRR